MQCLKECPDSYYGFEKYCHKCLNRCLKCIGGTENDCTECDSPLYLHQNQVKKKKLKKKCKFFRI
jgi:hypothetical protein